MKKSPLNNKIIPTGKIGPELLDRLLKMPRKKSPDVIIGPRPGEDAAVVKFDQDLVVITSDPITFPTPKPGYYAVQVNANDIAVMGAIPKYFILTAIMPPGTTEAGAEDILAQAIQAADAMDIILIGGHTEVSESVNQVVISAAMFGQLIKDHPISTGGGKPGDAIIQVGFSGIEGTSILAFENQVALKREFGFEFVQKAQNYIYDPGLSVLAPARLATENLDVTAMHDPTEGGLATGLREMADASNTGLLINAGALLISEDTKKVCQLLGYDPLGLISSGCLLMTVPGNKADDANSLMQNAGYDCAIIGHLTENPGQFLMRDKSGQVKPLPEFSVDELAK